MSNTVCDFQNERPKSPGDFTFTWFIHNFSQCTIKENMSIDSPDFVVDFLGDAIWWLKIYPRGNGVPGFVSCYLHGRYLRGATCNFTLAIRMSDGQFRELRESIYEGHTMIYVYKDVGFSKFVSLEELKTPNVYLVNDTLIIRCRMWRTDTNIPALVKCEAHSRIKVSKLHYTWILKGISVSNQPLELFYKSIDITEFFIERTIINLTVFTNRALCMGTIYCGIKMTNPKKNYFWTCVVHLIDASGRIAHSACSEHLFETFKKTLDWHFPLISQEKLYHNKKLYMPNNQLTLRYELRFAADNILETFVYKTTNEFELESTTIDQHPDLQGVWIKNTQQCYTDGKFSDFIIRTPSQRFPVSRNILGAHSEVFDAMFERDKKERKTGVVDIEDLDDDTVSKMLMYVYTRAFSDIDCSAAQKLYFAADKYRITALQKKCSTYLMGCLDASNVCNILEFADTHRDQNLKSCARDFFHAHAKEIIGSESWKKLKDTNSPLTTETMEWMICIS